MDNETQGLGYDILTADDLFRRSLGKICLNAKKEFTQKNGHAQFLIHFICGKN